MLAAAVSQLRTISVTGGRPSGPEEADESCDRPHKRQELGQSCFGQGVDPQRKPAAAAAASSRRRATGPRRTTGASTKEPIPAEKVSVLLQHFHNHQYVSPEVRNETHCTCCPSAWVCLQDKCQACYLSAMRAAADVASNAARARSEEDFEVVRQPAREEQTPPAASIEQQAERSRRRGSHRTAANRRRGKQARGAERTGGGGRQWGREGP